jgi:hypothetical protein
MASKSVQNRPPPPHDITFDRRQSLPHQPKTAPGRSITNRFCLMLTQYMKNILDDLLGD